MRNIKINEEQDKEIRKVIKENMLSTDTLLGGVGVDGEPVQPVVTTNEPVKPGDEMKTLKALDNVATKTGTDKTAIQVPNPGKPNKTITQTTPDNTAEANKVTNNESIIISKKQLDEIRLKNLKENSEVVKIKNFLK